MTTVARNVEEEQRRAWDDYAERLQGLEGQEYSREEEHAWDDLQATLRELGVASAPAADPLG